MKLKKVCTKHLMLQYLNSIRLGPSFLYNEAFSFKKKFRKKKFNFFRYTFLYLYKCMKLSLFS